MSATQRLLKIIEEDDYILHLRTTGRWSQEAFETLAYAMEAAVLECHGHDVVPACLLPIFFNYPVRLEKITSHPDFVRIQVEADEAMHRKLELAWSRLRHLQRCFFDRLSLSAQPHPRNWPGKPDV